MRLFLACMLGAVALVSETFADIPTTDASADLKALGFKDKSYLLTTAGTVSEQLTGEYNIQANEVSTGGAVIELGRTDNTLTGGTYVKSGMLIIPGIGALGSSTVPIVIGGRSTAHFSETCELNQNIVILPESGQWTDPGIISVAEGKTVTLNGRICSARDCNSSYYSNWSWAHNNLYKRGAGTLILKGKNSKLGYSSGTISSGWRYGWIKFNEENGEFLKISNQNYWPFAILDGRVVIDTADSETTDIRSSMVVGGPTTLTGTETAGHFELRHGVVNAKNIWLARANGNKTTAPDGLSSSLTVSGGVLKSDDFYVGDCAETSSSYGCIGDSADPTNSTVRPVVNVTGGRFEVASANGLSFGTPVNATFNISGGTFQVSNVRGGTMGMRGQNVQFNISGTGVFAVTNEFRYYVKEAPAFLKSVFSGSSFEISLSEGGTLALRRFWDPKEWYSTGFYVYADGGVFKILQASKADEGLDSTGGGTTGRLFVKNGGLTIDVSDVYANGPKLRFPMLKSAAASTGEVKVVGVGKGVCLHFEQFGKRGGEVLAAAFKTDESKIHLGGRDSYPTEFKIGGSGAISARGWFDTAVHTNTIDKLTFGATGTLEVGHSADAARTPSLLVANAFTPPTERLNVKTFKTVSGKVTNEEEAPLGTFDILKYPKTVTLDVAKCRYAGEHKHLLHTFTTETSGEWTTLKMTVEKKGLILLVK